MFTIHLVRTHYVGEPAFFHCNVDTSGFDLQNEPNSLRDGKRNDYYYTCYYYYQ